MKNHPPVSPVHPFFSLYKCIYVQPNGFCLPLSVLTSYMHHMLFFSFSSIWSNLYCSFCFFFSFACAAVLTYTYCVIDEFCGIEIGNVFSFGLLRSSTLLSALIFKGNVALQSVFCNALGIMVRGRNS